jgi:hypothetical protein
MLNGQNLMIKHQFSFAKINILAGNIAEIIVEKNVEVSLEMSEELNDFLSRSFSDNFALLYNKINHYDYSFEAKMSMASHENLAAIAVITYDNESKKAVEKIALMRQVDDLNLKMFNGLNLGYKEGLAWLQSQLN